MKSSMFRYLLWANPKNSANSEEQIFYDTNAHFFNEELAAFNDNSSLFGIIKSDIVLFGLVNKAKMDKDIASFTENQLKDPFIISSMHTGLPYLSYKQSRIYIPTYSQAVNDIYGHNPNALKSFPYYVLLKDSKASLIDPFDTYGNLLFSSPFARLIKLDAHDQDSNAFYHPEYQTIFVINNFGCLEQEIPLFDEKCRDYDSQHLFDRLETLMRDYYQNNRDSFLTHLLTLGLISQPLYIELKGVTDKADNFQKKRLRK